MEVSVLLKRQADKERLERTQKKEELLSRGIIIVNRLIEEKSSNEVRYLEFEEGGAGIFKPRDGEKLNLRQFTKAGTYYLRERAYYLVDKALEFGLVEPTVIRSINGRIGSVQNYIPNARFPHDLTPYERGSLWYQAQIRKLWILDLLARHSDRKDMNILIAGKKLNATDNGLAFSRDILFLNGRCWEQDMPPEIAMAMGILLCSREKRKKLDEDLRQLLQDDEVSAFWIRLCRIYDCLVKNDNRIPWDARDIYEFN